MSHATAFNDRTGAELLISRDFTAAELSGRRGAIAAAIGPTAHLLVAGAPPVPEDRLVQDAAFYYFTGLDTCHSHLLIDGSDGSATLFLPSRDTIPGQPEDKLGFEDATLLRERLQVRDVRPPEALTEALREVRTLYLPHAEVEGGGATLFGANGCARRREEQEWDQAEPRHKRLIRLLKERFPAIGIADASPLIAALRTIKSPAEIEVLRQAGRLSANVMIESMKATRPGITENRLQAIAEYVFRDQGHCGLGYGVIAAGGTRTWDGHYHRNNMTLAAGEVVLMDCGPDLRHYSSDIARMWPVNGVFDDWHRGVYGMIVEYHKTLLELVRPGALVQDIYAEAARRMVEWSGKDASRREVVRPLVEQMIQRGVGYLNHAVGMSVHDAIGPWRDEPLREGFVCVLDPMIWCEAEHEYIRIEDTLVITADGCERLTGDAPIEIDEIEALVGTHS